MNISILSVAPPYRGGIAEQTFQLYTNLKKEHEVSIINFSRQYPEFLFPGKSQYDSDMKSDMIDNNFQIVDSINPISWRRASRKIVNQSPELLILRFWNPFFAISHGKIIRKVKKHIPGLKVVAICDNIIPHERSMLDKILINYLFKVIDGFIVMSPQVESELKNLVEDPCHELVFHPVTSKQIELTKSSARSNLNIKHKKIIMFFGFVREYKGLDVLIKANQYLKDRLDDYCIIVCGECYGDEKQYRDLIEKFSYNNEIYWINDYISEELAANYFMASDVTVLPYKSASQSGVIPLSYAYDSPVIASSIPGIQEMVDDGETGFLFEKNNASQLADKIIEFYDSDTDYRKNIIEYRKKFEWSNFIEKLFNLSKKIS